MLKSIHAPDFALLHNWNSARLVNRMRVTFETEGTTVNAEV
jgi:hypothetical protein